MAVAVVSREDNAFADDNPPPARNAILARYRQLREISKRHHHDILKFISGNAMPHGGNELGPSAHKNSDHRGRWLLSARHRRPRDCRTAEQRDELAASDESRHLIPPAGRLRATR